MRGGGFTMRSLLVLAAALLHSTLAVELSVDDARVIKEAGFAVEEISNLSDSGVYHSLSLGRILSARLEEGLYHENLVLSLEMKSAHYASGASEEVFEVVVMTHKEDDVKSIAIDEFPIMKDSSIESFYERRVEEKSKEREESFRRLEIESILSDSPVGDNASRVREMMERENSPSIRTLLDGLETPDLRERRKAESSAILAQLPKRYATEENAMQDLSLSQLYDMTVGEHSPTNYQKSRSQDILDWAIQQL